MELNEDQLNAISRLRYFIEDDNYFTFYLFGYAGTGKTLIISEFIKQIDKSISVYVSAPTHTALNVLQTKTNNNEGIKYFTIHSLLEMKMITSVKDGSRSFGSGVKKSKNLTGKGKKIALLDECSMISLDMYEKIVSNINLTTKVVFVGDPAQLPPVKEASSMVFQKVEKLNKVFYPYFVVLENIERTQNDAIKAISTIVRNYKKNDNLTELFLKYHRENKYFKMFHKEADMNNAKWFKLYKKIYDLHPMMLTWTNNASHSYNNFIRKTILGTTSENFIEGDVIIFNKHYNSQVIDGVSHKTAEICQIDEISVTSESLKKWNRFKVDDSVSYCHIVNKLFDELDEVEVEEIDVNRIKIIYGEGKDDDIFVISRDHQDIWETHIKTLMQLIKDWHHDNLNNVATRFVWDIYYRNFVDRYADINFGYSMTVHKSQGSTFDVVYVDMEDILSNPNCDEAIKCLYTAVTRASNQLYILI